MDEHNDEQPDQHTEELSSWDEPEATGAEAQEPSDTPFGPRATPRLWAAAGEESSPAALSGDLPGGVGTYGRPSFAYGPGTYPPGAYPPPGYAALGQAPSTAPGGYGPGGYPPGTYPPGAYGPDGPKGLRRGRKLGAAVAAALVLIGVGGGAGIAYATRQGSGTAAGLAASPAGHSLTTAQIAAAVDPGVVDINTNLGEGTGMIATSNGEIITNNHVIEDATTISVVIDHRGTYKATVVGTDASGDVAVLQLSGVSGLPTVKFGNSSTVRIGNSVVAIGNAGGQGFPSTVTAGAVTALGRTITASDDYGLSESLTGTIQTDALIEPGNSGGPLVDSAGDVIGMDTAAASADGATPIGFALPINKVLQIANDIEQGKAGRGIVIGTVAFLGIEGATTSAQGSGPATGVGLEYVAAGTPAYAAGLEAGDVIIAFDGHTTPTMSTLAALIHKLRPGDRVKVTFESPYGGTQTVAVTLATAPPA